MDPDAPVTGSLLNIWSGQVAQPNVNVDRALDIGAKQMTSFRDHGQMIFIPRCQRKWSHSVQRRNFSLSGEHAVIGLLVSQRALNFHEVLARELTAYPPSIFHADGQMRVAAVKSTLKKNVQVDVSQRFAISPTAIVYFVVYVFCYLDTWMAYSWNCCHFHIGIQDVALSAVVWSWRLCVLTGITTTPSKVATTSRVHHVTLTTPLPAQELHQQGTAERAYLWSSAMC